MFDFFDTIIGYLEQVWTMLVNLVNMLITSIQTTLIIAQLPNFLIGLMPSVIMSSVFAVVSFGIIKFLLGR